MKQVEFPNDYEDFLRLGEGAVAAGDLLLAIQHYQAAYQIGATFSLNYILVNLLIEVGENQKAYTLAGDFPQEYLAETDTFKTYWQLLILNRQFLEARKWLLYFQRQEKYEDFLTIAQQQLAEAEAYVLKFEKQRIQRLLTLTDDLATVSLNQQFARIKELKELPYEKFIQVSRKLLIQPELNYFSRLRLVEDLVEIAANQEIDFLWYNGEIKTLLPKAMTMPAEVANYLASAKLLREALEDDNPVMLPALLDELKLHFAIVYPFSDEVFTQPQLIVASYLADYQLADVDEALLFSPAGQALQAQKQKLREFTLNFN
ncbi:hypothetical protein M2139_000172 [Enterococcus sp. PF1-24]|uniref:hypothetical protein n=1 Tax=unclassified Enterococcus TaxID=2608891 RepID=UPI0024759593|nr:MULTISPECIES: hypothetical protein [unclassified Enterococcus]MDH6363197.1 hypothetical protein [Enterococcus sp. PFB1-1]MDH6400291.1 hypothetical protein [Enterococcus sp. PF1-24]